MLRRCPKCEGMFEQIEYLGVTVDRCLSCQGLWFDFAEREELLDIDGSETIDTGVADPDIDDLRKITCINCDVTMIPLSDNEQAHVEYEVCPKCYAFFLDAGEFRDLKELTINEWLQAQIRKITK